MIIELFDIEGIELPTNKMVRLLLSYQNKNGGFGENGYSSLNSTYNAVASLSSLGYPVRTLRGTLAYVRSCEEPSGGFTIIPGSSQLYMEHVHYGVSTLELLGEHPRYLGAIAKFILRRQNSNGGFARSDIGISTFEDTFYAVNTLRKIVRNRYAPPDTCSS